MIISEVCSLNSELRKVAVMPLRGHNTSLMAKFLNFIRTFSIDNYYF